MVDENIKRRVLDQLAIRIGKHAGLAIFAKERAKFEGWLKAELCDVLVLEGREVVPEKGRVDVVSGGWAIELKTLNTNYRYPGVINKTRPITKNVEGVVKDIEQLKNTKYNNKIVLFVVFPVEHDKVDWKMHLEKIEGLCSTMDYKFFKFNNGIPGMIYMGQL